MRQGDTKIRVPIRKKNGKQKKKPTWLKWKYEFKRTYLGEEQGQVMEDYIEVTQICKDVVRKDNNKKIILKLFFFQAPLKSRFQ